MVDQDGSLDPAPAASAPGDVTTEEPAGRHRKERSRVRRIFTWTIVGVLSAVVIWSGASFYGTYKDSDGEPMSVIVATWMRDNHMGPLVAQLENVYYRYVDRPAVGGEPTLSADLATEDNAGTDNSDLGVVRPATNTSESTPLLLAPAQPLNPATAPQAPSAPNALPVAPTQVPATLPHLEPPAALESPAKSPQPKEGVWQPVASYVNGQPAVYVTRVRADNVHTSYYASVMWIDTSLTKAMFVPGYQEPGGPNPYNGALPKDLWPAVLANFNGAFRLDDTQAGYYYKGKTVRPLVNGKASTVIYKDGTIKVGKWGRDVKMTKDVDVVRQNLNLIVDSGKSKVTNGADNVVWGATTDKESLAWRAAIGQRADGSIVYVGSPYLSADGLANVLVLAGAEEAMVLDMNNWWTAGFYFRHSKDGKPLCRKLDPSIQEGCDRFLNKYKRDSFQFLSINP
jgi:hypothetical protein